MDVFDAIKFNGPWELMVAFPPCTYLCNSGVRWLYKPDNRRNGKRWTAMIDAAGFFERLLDANIPKICVENPTMHRHARELIFGCPSQAIHPWQFGHGETKRTCLWLKGLPKLVPTNIVEGRTARVHLAPGSRNQWKERSRSLPGIAKAMADQWG